MQNVEMSVADDVYLSRKDAAKYLSRLGCAVSPRYLQDKAFRGGGPAFTRTGLKIVRYAKVDLDAWAKSNTKRVE